MVEACATLTAVTHSSTGCPSISYFKRVRAESARNCNCWPALADCCSRLRARLFIDWSKLGIGSTVPASLPERYFGSANFLKTSAAGTGGFTGHGFSPTCAPWRFSITRYFCTAGSLAHCHENDGNASITRRPSGLWARNVIAARSVKHPRFSHCTLLSNFQSVGIKRSAAGVG